MEMTALLFGFVINMIIGAAVIHISARFAGIENAALKKALVVALIGVIVLLIFGSIPIFSIVILFIAIMVLIRVIYLTTWPKAFVAAFVYVIVMWVISFAIRALTA